ncbi:MAG: bifunctional hydroxymethylpyrimidine kinase/phosphomethylpyrimidine kinase, partial [Giesbergeria sp.]|nr:bifunctional hydroxymethylpyrimidine kinase/phosphomethylpyrimidine kinase [Giesbergeria sp.]
MTLTDSLPPSQFPRYARVLSIAGSDSGGGAGIQADLKTFSALGCYGMTAITAITAQNTQGVRAIHGVPAQMLRAQIDAVLEDIGADA